ncbi:MAG TPA: TIR domain-containing protein [Chthoniobacterales bacterium]
MSMDVVQNQSIPNGSIRPGGQCRHTEETMDTFLSPNSNGKYQVFFSHKKEDAEVTDCIKGLLDRHTENVDYFISENIEKGTNWRQAIAKQLTLSSFLVLVFTDPNEDWGWCLYETGFFDALTQNPGTTPNRRIYCLHHASTEPPSPIADLQAVPAKIKDVSQWLNELFEHTGQIKQAFRDDIPKIAEKLCGFFAERKPIYSAKSMNITVKCSNFVSPESLPEDTIIKGDLRLMEEVFGTNTGIIDWKSVKERFSEFPDSSEANFNALKEISRALYGIYRNKRVLPVQGTIFVGQGPKRYRAVVNNAKELSADRISCEVLLIEDVGGPLQNVDKPLGALLTSIRMAVRIRWEIVRPFVLKSNLRILATNARKLRYDLQTCFNNIFIEAEFRGNFSPDDVWCAFETRADQSKFQTMIEEWGHTYAKIWRGIGFEDVTKRFSEVSEEPFSDQEIALLEAGMRELEKMNSDFLDMAVSRSEVLVQRELGITNSRSALQAIDIRSHSTKRRRGRSAKFAA